MKQPIHPAMSQPLPFALSLSKGADMDWASTSSARAAVGSARKVAGPGQTATGAAQTVSDHRVFNLDARSLLTRGRRRALLLGKSVWQHLPPRSAPAMHVFVAGMQRSGTNMVMDVLERSQRTDVYHENDPRAFERFEMREEAVIRALVTRSRAPFFVIKALCELDRLPALMDSFAPARTLWVRRDFEDVVNSATRSFSNILFFERKLDRDPRVLLVSYEKLVTDPEARFHRIFESLEIPYTPWISRIVFASSIRRRPPPPIEPEVRVLCEDLMRRFQCCLGGNQNHG